MRIIIYSVLFDSFTIELVPNAKDERMPNVMDVVAAVDAAASESVIETIPWIWKWISLMSGHWTAED